MLSDEWRKEAFSRFPELKELWEDPGDIRSPYALWIELNIFFDEAYEPPANEDLIKRVYEYAQWCETQPRGTIA